MAGTRHGAERGAVTSGSDDAATDGGPEDRSASARRPRLCLPDGSPITRDRAIKGRAWRSARCGGRAGCAYLEAHVLFRLRAARYGGQVAVRDDGSRNPIARRPLVRARTARGSCRYLNARPVRSEAVGSTKAASEASRPQERSGDRRGPRERRCKGSGDEVPRPRLDSGLRGSNPSNWLGKPGHYHYAKPALCRRS